MPEATSGDMRKVVDPYEVGNRARWADEAKEDPQAHIDALVEAGVLERMRDMSKRTASGWEAVYSVVTPHEHDWRYDMIFGHAGYVICIAPGHVGQRPVNMRLGDTPQKSWPKYAGADPDEVPEHLR